RSSSVQIVVAELFAGIGQVFRADDPPDALLNGGKIFEQVRLQIVGAAAHEGSLDSLLAARGAWHSVAAHADSLQPDPSGVHVRPRLEVIDHRFGYSFGV